MAAVPQKKHSAKSARKRVALAEVELRLRVRPGIRQVLADLMKWSGITEQGEAMTLMIHHLHAMGSAKCQPLLNPPRHESRYRKTWRGNIDLRKKKLQRLAVQAGDIEAFAA
ncbi:hypothetical protein SAMN04490190_0954 [Pseudomonas libanensis]|uniref:Prophage PSSB64-02 n=1 Tax=Pseudomonas libanensis TaxID=75588 RepID=A0A0R2YAL6_9PSED|nr:hypothetical protein [Pseudomonas libanensis]KRP45318.1 prophage PSSB64-02 [Pseudomonas libanensis]SDK66201.1 hypothetical protein SAMN04490190_0954 [Pseudomonas libanensis]